MSGSVLDEVKVGAREGAGTPGRGVWRFYAASFVLPLLAMVGYWVRFIRADYRPSEDEFALIVSSGRMFHPSMRGWFLEGFGRYFVGYPGLSRPVTDFVRPVVNGAYWVNSAVWGERWAWYLLLTYAVQAGLVWVSVKLAVEVGRVPRWVAGCVGVMMFVSPAFGWQQMFLTSFTFDLFGALFVMLALHEVWRRRYVTAWVLILLAVFTKETTLFLPVLLAFRAWVPGLRVRRRVLWTAAWLAPVGAWLVVRHVAFHGHAGVYVLNGAGLKAQAAGVVHGVLAWPFGTRTARQSVGVRWLFWPLNAGFWVGCGVAMARWRRLRFGVTEVGVALCAGALAMPLLLNLPLRFGACFYPLFFLVLAKMAWAGEGVWVRRGAAACLAVGFVTALYQKAVDPWGLEFARSEWALAGSYVEAIKGSDAKTLLLVDDASGAFTAPELVARFAGFKGTLVRANNVEVLDPSKCEGQPRVKVEGGTVTSFVAPPCGFYTFDSVPPERIGREMVSTVGGTSVRILAPEVKGLPGSGTLGMYGELRVEASGEVAVLVPELGGKVYRVVR